MTAELEAEPRCLEYSVSKTTFTGNGILRPRHQKITGDPHSWYFVVLDTKPNGINYRMKKTAVCKTFCLEQNLPPREPDPQEDHASSPRHKHGSSRHRCYLKMGEAAVVSGSSLSLGLTSTILGATAGETSRQGGRNGGQTHTSTAGKVPFEGEMKIRILNCTSLSAAFFIQQHLMSASFLPLFFDSWHYYFQISSF